MDALIPYDKSWLMRLGLLDILHGRHQIEQFVIDNPSVSDDIQALARASQQWRANQPIDVGESGTLLRFLQYATWARQEDRVFIKSGTLENRRITNDPSIVGLSLNELLELDNGTSQWASAAVMLGNNQKPKIIPYKLELTYEALSHWKNRHGQNENWTAIKDETIAKQATAYKKWLRTGKINFNAEQAEDYCFARAFGLITPKQGEKLWPSLRQHESDRIESMEIALNQNIVDSKDHRVVQAVAMFKSNRVKFLHPDCVSKSWPLFWIFIKSLS